MATSEPGQVIETFINLFNSGDHAGLLDLYEDGVTFVGEPGSPPAVGKAAVSQILEGFLAMKGTMTLVASSTIVSGDIGLCHDHWRLEAPDADPMEGTTADVVRRQADGSWRYVIDNPWGSAVVQAGQGWTADSPPCSPPPSCSEPAEAWRRPARRRPPRRRAWSSRASATPRSTAVPPPTCSPPRWWA